MNDPFVFEFKKFGKLAHLDNIRVRITQKIDGTNAQIVISPEGELLACSKNRVLTEHSDNYNFYKFCMENKQVLIDFLGVGRHYGEWAGPKINSGEGLTENTLVLFDYWKYKDQQMPLEQLTHVPILLDQTLDHVLMYDAINTTNRDLQLKGSKLVPGFMDVEGMVLQIGSQSMKYRFRSGN